MRGGLYVGTENGIYVSFNDGELWQPLQNDLPHAPVSGIVVQEHFDDLVISTYGRGFWIMDDIGALRATTPAVLAKTAHLYAPRDAYRFRPITAPSTTYDDPTSGDNPEYGASINYYLKGALPDSSVKVAIMDSQGAVVRTITGTNAAGINRINWDLKFEPSTEVRLRTSPMYAPHIVPDAKGREAPGTGTFSILAPPGRYTVRLTAGGVTETQPLVVLKDPHSGGTESDIAAQTRMLTTLRHDLDRAADAVHRIEKVRVQLDTLTRVNDIVVQKAAQSLQQQMTDLEMNLVELRMTGEGQDGVRFGARLISKLGYLANGIAASDYKPTDQHGEVQRLLERELRGHLAALDALMAKELVAFNALLKERNMPTVVVKARGISE